MYIKEVKISNFGSFGEDVSVALNSPNEPVLIIGENRDQDNQSSNGAAKSMFMYSILWCFTGSPPPRFSADDIIRKGTKECSVEVILTDGNKEIRIRRIRGSTQTLEFYIDDKLVNKKTESSTSVQKTINDYFGLSGTKKEAANDFYYTNFLTYKSVEQFVTKDSDGKEKFELISRMFNLDKWIKYREANNERLKTEKKNLEYVNNEIDYINNKISEINYNKLVDLQSDYNEQIEKTKKLINKIEKELDKVNKILVNKERLNNLISKLKTKKQEFINQMKVLRGELRSNLRYIEDDDIEKKIELIDKDIEKKEFSIRKLRIVIDNKWKVQRNIDDLDRKIKENEKIIDDIKNNRIVKCPECNTDLIIDGIEIKKTDKGETRRIIRNCKVKIKRYKDKINKLLDELSAIEEHEQLVNKTNLEIHKLTTARNEYVRRLSMSNDARDRVDRLYVTMNSIRADYKEDMLKIIKDIREVKKLIGDENVDSVFTKEDLMRNTNRLIDLNSKLSDIENQIEIYERNKSSVEKLEIKRNGIEKKVAMMKYWNKAFLEIRRLIIQSLIPSIESETNKFLKMLGTSFIVRFNTLKKTKTTDKFKSEFTIEVYDKSDGTVKPVDMRSTGERKRIGIATCFALQEIKASESNNTLDFKFTDEVADNIDSDGLSEFFKCINNMNSQVFVISHDNDLQSRFNNVIKIVKENGVSLI